MIPEKETVLVVFLDRLADILTIVAMGVFLEVVGYVVAIIAGLLSIIHRIPRIRSDVKKYHGGSWSKYLKSILKLKN